MENTPIDTSTELLGRKLAFPLLTAPIGSLKLQFNPTDDIGDFNEKCMAACESRGILHAFGNGLTPGVWDKAIASGRSHGNNGIPVFNPASVEEIKELMDQYKGGLLSPAMCVVVDSAGLPHLRRLNAKGGTKTVAELREYAKTPMIIKGIMTADAAKKAVDAGADAIVVSNHGGRVLADAPSTAEVLPEIVEAVKGQTKILIDGGILFGIDVFKALAMGADACLICRPVLISYYGGGQEGIECYLDKIREELVDAMYMFDAALRNTRIEMSPAERRQFYEKHIRHMTLTIDENGNVSIELKRGYPDISPSKAPARTRHRPHRTPQAGRRTVTPAHEATLGVCPYSLSCFTCPLPDCRQPANVCLGVNRLTLEWL